MADELPLDRLVRVMRATVAPNAFNELVETWGLFTKVYGNRRDMSFRDRERLQAAELNATMATRFEIRWTPKTAQITAKDRFLCEGVWYDIVPPIAEIGRRYRLVISCTSRVD